MSPSSDRVGSGTNGKKQGRLFAIVWMFAAMVAGLLVFSVASIELLSGVRAYTQGEALWSKGQKDAINALTRYALYADEADFANFRQSLDINLGDRQARQELLKSDMDLALTHAGLLRGRNHPDDFSTMIFLVRRMRWLPEVGHAVAIWTEADQYIERLDQIGETIHQATRGEHSMSYAERQQFLDGLHQINSRLTPLEEEFSSTLGVAARKYTALVLLVMFLTVSVLLVGAWRGSRRMLRDHEAVQRALEQEHQQLQATLQFAPLPIVIARADDESIVYANERSLLQFKMVAPVPGALHLRDLYVDAADRARLMIASQGTGNVRDFELQMQDVNGKSFWVQYSAQHIRWGELDCLMVALVDIDEKRRVHDDLRYRAYHDVLTGLPNRAMFMDSLRRTLGRMERKRGMFSLLFIDLDHFKEVNDELGHDMGDLLLQSVTQRLQSCVRSSDLVARLGGDEFVVLIEEHDADADAHRIAQKILVTLAPVYDLNGQAAQVTASIGISRYPQDGVELNGLLTAADAAMYCAKTRGKNNVQFYRREDSEQ